MSLGVIARVTVTAVTVTAVTVTAVTVTAVTVTAVTVTGRVQFDEKKICASEGITCK